GDDPEVVLDGEAGDALELGPREDLAVGVVGRDEVDRFGARGEGGLEERARVEAMERGVGVERRGEGDLDGARGGGGGEAAGRGGRGGCRRCAAGRGRRRAARRARHRCAAVAEQRPPAECAAPTRSAWPCKGASTKTAGACTSDEPASRSPRSRSSSPSPAGR